VFFHILLLFEFKSRFQGGIAMENFCTTVNFVKNVLFSKSAESYFCNKITADKKRHALEMLFLCFFHILLLF